MSNNSNNKTIEYRILRSAAMTQIVQRWRTIQEISDTERITYRVRNEEPEYKRRWVKWVRYEATL